MEKEHEKSGLLLILPGTNIIILYTIDGNYITTDWCGITLGVCFTVVSRNSKTLYQSNKDFFYNKHSLPPTTHNINKRHFTQTTV